MKSRRRKLPVFLQEIKFSPHFIATLLHRAPLHALNNQLKLRPKTDTNWDSRLLLRHKSKRNFFHNTREWSLNPSALCLSNKTRLKCHFLLCSHLLLNNSEKHKCLLLTSFVIASSIYVAVSTRNKTENHHILYQKYLSINYIVKFLLIFTRISRSLHSFLFLYFFVK